MTELEKLHVKAMSLVKEFEHLPEKDIRRKHFEAVASQIAVSLIDLKINSRFFETNPSDLEKLFKGDRHQIENYIFNLEQSVVESILDTFLFQTESVMRFLYSKLTGEGPAQESNIQKIIAALFEDVQSNWKKEESKLFVLFWTCRNTIHTGGIYFKNTAGYSLTYKSTIYKFEYGKSINFFKDGHLFELLTDILDALKYLFNSKIIVDLGSIEHPSYNALGK